MACSANSGKRKQWHIYAEYLTSLNDLSKHDIIRKVSNSYPDVNKATIQNYVYTVIKNKGILRPEDVYCCTMCQSIAIKTSHADYFIDHIKYEKECCTCKFIWNTIEIDEDMYMNLVGGKA